MFTRSKVSNSTPIEDEDRAVREGISESGSELMERINQINREDIVTFAEKANYADQIFRFLMERYRRPLWFEDDAIQFKFSSANAMRHFLRKYSDPYNDYKEQVKRKAAEQANDMPSVFDIDKKQSYRENLNNSVFPNLSVTGTINNPPIAQRKQQQLHRIDLATGSDLNASQIADLLQDRELKQFLKADEDDTILDSYKKTYSYQGKPEDEGLPVFDGKLALAGDMLLVGDIHVPTTNWAFMERITQIAKRHMSRPRRIAIVGDILNGDKDSRYEHIIAPISRYKEFKITDALLRAWAKIFDEIYITPGNHLHRLIRRLEGDIGMNELARLLTSAHEKINMSHYDEVHVTSGDEHWVATHQANYAKSKLKIGNLLAQKFQSNIITFHQHHSAIGRDDYNRYTVIDCGGMHRQDMMSYVQLVPNVMPNMNNGFVLLRDGTGHLLTPYPSITDWSMWV